MAEYLRPTELSEALEALSDGARVIIAGGTDFYPARVGRPLDDDVLDITALDDLRGIREDADGHRIGALVTWTELAEADLPPWFDGLKAAAREIGGRQIQNAATVCGNVCNASPAADGIPNLLALDARIELASAEGSRSMPVGDFVLGNRRTALRPGEMATALVVPRPRHPARAAFVKVGGRRYLVISIVMAAAVLEVDGAGRVAAARVSVGACSPVARRLPALETALLGRPLDAGLAAVPEESHLDVLRPIDDMRGSAAYRRRAALTAVARALAGIAEGAP